MITFLRSCSKYVLLSFVFLATVLIADTCWAQVKFSVVCPDKKIGKNDLLQIQFKVENASQVDDITPPSFKDFNIVEGPNQQRSVTSINGKVSQYVAIGYSLQAKSSGTFTIGPATASADGKQYKTAPVTIEVVNGSVIPPAQNNSAQNVSPFPNLNFDLAPAPVTHQFDDYILKPGENVAQKTEKNIFLKLEVNKTKCYTGEPIVATYKLYTRLPSETTITDAPSFNGFSVSDLDVNNDAVLETYEGRKYNVYTIRKVELYPLQAGNITLDPVVASNKITFVKSAYANNQGTDGFFDMLQNFGADAIPPEGLVEQTVTLKSAPLTVNVKPLPARNKPEDFRGAVGDFTIASSLEKNHITTDDAGSLQLTVTGKGNIQLINAPVINWPAGIDGYEAKVSDHIDKTKIPMQGSKTFSYPFTVSKAGTYQIDSISFSYFDPATSSYKTVHSAPLQVTVEKGKGLPGHSFVKTETPVTPGKNDSRTELAAGIVFIVAMILLIVFLMIKKTRNRNDLEKNIKLDDLKNEEQEQGEKFVIPESPLTAAHEQLVNHNSKEFFHILDTSLKKYLAAKFKVPENELSKKRLNEELDKCNVSLGTSLMLTSLLDEVELNLYAPTPDACQLNTIFEKASNVVSLLDKQVCN